MMLPMPYVDTMYISNKTVVIIPRKCDTKSQLSSDAVLSLTLT